MNRNILVIDDQESILEDFRTILCPGPETGCKDSSQVTAAARLLGFEAREEEPEETYNLTTAGQGRHGFELARDALDRGEPFAVAFIDIRMPPGWDGMKTAAEIRRIDKNIEIVIVSAYSDRDRKEIVKNVGSPEKLLYLKKPFDMEEIRQLALCLTQKWELHRRERNHRVRLEKLLERITSIKTFMGDSQKIISLVLDEVREEVGAEKGLVVQIENGEISIEARYGQFNEEEIRKILEGISREELRSGAIIELGEYLLLPLRTEGLEVVIVFGNHIKDEDIPFLNLFLSSMSELINNTRLFEKSIRNEKMASVGLATETILHDLRNPLTLVANSVDFCLIQSDLPVRLRKYMGTAKEGTRRIVELLTDISDYTLRNVHLRVSPVSLSSFVEEAMALWSDQFARNNVVASLDVGADVLMNIDRIRFRRVLDNLIVNALDAMEGMEDSRLAISAVTEGSKAILKVGDTGPGISEQIRPRIFEPFQSHGKRRGTGLGLAIVKEFVDLHGGQVRFETGPGGTTFFVELPKLSDECRER